LKTKSEGDVLKLKRLDDAKDWCVSTERTVERIGHEADEIVRLIEGCADEEGQEIKRLRSQLRDTLRRMANVVLASLDGASPQKPH
jgi:hypothetical protein